MKELITCCGWLVIGTGTLVVCIRIILGAGTIIMKWGKEFSDALEKYK